MWEAARQRTFPLAARTLQREVRMRDIDPRQPPLRLSILTLPMTERSFSVFAGVQRKQLEAQKS